MASWILPWISNLNEGPELVWVVSGTELDVGGLVEVDHLNGVGEELGVEVGLAADQIPASIALS
jgi:hypothetical protein